ncbi:penicillin-binding transpeptidase domain-containing protein [Streptomyces sp. NPDC005012]|uniref:penicillin-binding transpeptidase domain-containing protein n=1 Tax=unclassified Streptomyces TaxID=2593676 RepID=UPI0033BB0A82
MTSTVRHAGLLCLLLLAALLVNAARVQVLEAGAHERNPANRRADIDRYHRPRGDILVAGRPVTGSVDTGDRLRHERTYTDGPLYAPVTGFASQAYGTTLLEAVEDDVLSGRHPLLAALPLLGGPADRGGDVETTVVPAAQRAGFEGLDGRKGAVVALEPATGRILALVSTPSYDPAALSGNGPAAARAWRRLLGDPDQPLLNRAVRQTYPPGSTFKVVTAAAALEARLVRDLDRRVGEPGPYRLPGTGTELTDERAECGRATLRQAFEWSCNTVFARLGVRVGAERMARTAAAFGFNDDGLRVPFGVARSTFDPDVDRAQLALASIGQFNTRATPLQMARVAAVVAGGGTTRTPYLVERTTTARGTTIGRAGPRGLRQVLRPATARLLRELMTGVVTDGTGGQAAIDGAVVGGKTGTAQHGVGNAGTPYAWFVSWARGEGELEPRVAVAVVVEDAAADRGDITGGDVAAPVARAVMRAVLSS